jgi:hypothetical protein
LEKGPSLRDLTTPHSYTYYVIFAKRWIYGCHNPGMARPAIASRFDITRHGVPMRQPALIQKGGKRGWFLMAVTAP